MGWVTSVHGQGSYVHETGVEEGQEYFDVFQIGVEKERRAESAGGICEMEEHVGNFFGQVAPRAEDGIHYGHTSPLFISQ